LKSDPDEDSVIICTGLLAGITAYHIRILTEAPFNGGGGLSYEDVGNMTPDQVWHRLCKMDLLERTVGNRTRDYSGVSAQGVLETDEEGFVKGRDSEGNLIKKKFGGKSLARRLMEESEGLLKKRKERSERKPKKRG